MKLAFFFLSYVDDTLQDSEEIVTKLSQQISDVSTDIIRNETRPRLLREAAVGNIAQWGKP